MPRLAHIVAIYLVLVTALAAEPDAVERARLDWWAFQVPQRPAVPALEKPGASHPIDAFVLARLESAGMEPAPEASRSVLIRRLYFDLIGLPPTADEVAQFVTDPGEEAYAKLVDRLLASRHFGERWARHWLDVVRYAETNGYERDAVKPNIWKYRDWVIRAFNVDMPFSQFVREQVAGDELESRTTQSVIATGMLRAGTWNDEPNDPHEYKYERLEDMVDVVTTGFLGVTVKCSRCHDHKFDPIPQRDYYRIAAAFWPGAIEPRDGKLMGGPSEDELGAKGVFGWTDVRDAPPLRLLEKGDAHREGPVVEPGVLSLVPELDLPMEPAPAGAKTSGRRARLAEFIANPRNPLTARVMVNRIWMQLLGEGIVRTPNNFGLKAAPPTHPELLDWLAVEFMQGGWSVKSLIRQIVMTRTYRQASVHPAEEVYSEKDSANRLLWKMNRRRVDAEALRDALLAVSGQLNLKQGGPSFYPIMAPEVLEGFSRKGNAWKPSPAEERRRRSVYMVSKRHLLLPLMTAFDFPNSEKPCGQRDVTTVATQALAMMNNHFVHEQSEALARRIEERGLELEKACIEIWREVFGRDPENAELALTLKHYRRQFAHFAKGSVARRDKLSEVPTDGLVLWLRADRAVQSDAEGRVAEWKDLSEGGHHATQPEAQRRPRYIAKSIGGRPAIRFSGRREFMELAGTVVSSQANAVLAVATDSSGRTDHRGIFSNWNGGAGNSTTSLFFGLTGKGTVRYSDDFRSSRALPEPAAPFVLAAATGASGTHILHNGAPIGSRPAALGRRNLAPPYVIAQQGNIDGEYWQGDVAELLVYDRELSAVELRELSALLAGRYGIALREDGEAPPERTPKFLALASVCHVLMNSNEFLYVD